MTTDQGSEKSEKIVAGVAWLPPRDSWLTRDVYLAAPPDLRMRWRERQERAERAWREALARLLPGERRRGPEVLRQIGSGGGCWCGCDSGPTGRVARGERRPAECEDCVSSNGSAYLGIEGRHHF